MDNFRLLETGYKRQLEHGDFRILQNSFPFVAIGMSGKLGEEGEPDPLGVKGIYQMRKTRRGKIPIKMKFYAPFNPDSEAQQVQRAKMGAAVSAWQALTAQEKLSYNERAIKKMQRGYDFFKQLHMKDLI